MHHSTLGPTEGILVVVDGLDASEEGRVECRDVDAWRSQRCRGSSGLVRQDDCIWRESSVRGATRRQRDADSTDGGCSLAQALKCGLSASRTSTPGREELIGGCA